MTTYYVSTSGGTGTGAIGDPWSLDYARVAARVSGGQLAAGDTVQLRGGTYSKAAGYDFTLSGSAGNPITFEAYPGETVVIDGAFSAFTTIGNSAWELYDAPTNTYRSVATTYQVGAATEAGGFIQIGGTWYPLLTHDPIGCLMGPTQLYRKTTDFYAGPGIAENSPDGRIYIRLEAVDQTVHYHTCATPDAGVDPANYDLRLFTGQTYGITATGSYLRFNNITCNDFYGMFKTTGTGNYFYGVTGRFGQFGCRVGSSNGTTLDTCTFDGLMNPQDYWVAWCDIKGGRTICDATRKCGIGGDAVYNMLVRNCTIANVFDGILCSGVSPVIAHDIEIDDCTFRNIWDDAWQMFSNIYNINFHDCMITGAGPSHDATGTNNANTAPGTVYIHDNIIDSAAVQIEWGRKDTLAQGTDYEGMGAPQALSSHGVPDINKWSIPWKIYQNTYVSGNYGISALGSGITWQLFGNIYAGHHHAERHEVYNNILIQPSPSRTIGRDCELNTGREAYDGNCYHITDDGNNKFFSFVHTAGGDLTTNATAGSLTKIRSHLTVGEQALFETAGLQVNPLLDASYRPQNATVMTGAVDLTGTGWPGTSVYKAYRGAVGPGASEAVPAGAHPLRRRTLMGG
jgi:hypothetical protein